VCPVLYYNTIRRLSVLLYPHMRRTYSYFKVHSAGVTVVVDIRIGAKCLAYAMQYKYTRAVKQLRYRYMTPMLLAKDQNYA
jgi:hypothetical protein